MSDLFDPLRDLDDLSSHPLPAAEVRRRGDRMRRRRHTLQALGGAAAVVVVAGGITVTTGLLDGTSDDPGPVATPAPEGGWLAEIPTHYPLDRGYPMADPPESTQLGPSQKFSPLTDQPLAPCGAAAYPSEHPVDSVGTVFTVGDSVYARELTLYADSTRADAVVSRLADAWEACPTEELPDPPFELTTSVTRDDVGDDSWTVVRGAPQFPGVQTYHVVRVGNAVLVNTASTEATLENAEALVDEQAAQVSPLVADMCIFALTPCSPVDPPDQEPMIPPLSDDALLTTDQLAELTGLSGWELLGQREDPTLDCQPVWLRNLDGAEKGSYREWRRDGSEAATAVLEFRDEGRASLAFSTAREWLEACDGMAGTRVLEPVADLLDTRILSSDVATRQFFIAMPEGGNRLDQQGVALVGTRVVFLAITPDRATGVEEERLMSMWQAALAEALDQARPMPVEPTGVDIPDDFPLLSGWPSDAQAETQEMGLEGPNRTLAPAVVTCAEREFDEPSHVDQLRAQWSNVEDFRFRQLTTYRNADAAVAAVEALVDFYRACPDATDPDVAGNITHYDVRETDVGGQSFGLVQYFSYDGAPTVGLSAYHVIRLGRAVLLIAGYNEGSGPGADTELAGQAEEAAEVIAAMCRFTEAGC